MSNNEEATHALLSVILFKDGDLSLQFLYTGTLPENTAIVLCGALLKSSTLAPANEFAGNKGTKSACAD